MIDKRHIYQWLLLPLLACLTAGMAGCSNDMTETGKGEGDSYLIIDTRGINNSGTPPDEYVNRIRVLAFDDNGGLVCNVLHTDFTVEADRAIIKQIIKGHRGKVRIYLVANESWPDNSGYEVYKAGSSNYYLPGELDKITKEDEFKQLILHYTPKIYIKGGTPFLMTGETVASLTGGNVSGSVELVRAFAKITVDFNLEDGGDWSGTRITELKLESNLIPNTFNLLEDKLTGFTGQYYSEADFLNGTDTRIIEDAALTEDNCAFSAYLPERILSGGNNTTDNAWKLSVKVNKKGRELSGEVLLNNDAAGDYNIYRNTEYAVDAAIPNAEALKLDVSASPWTSASKEIEWSNEVNFNLEITGANGSELVQGEDGKSYYPISHSTGGDGSQQGVVHCAFKLENPEGAEWAASLSDGVNFEFDDPKNSSGVGGEEKTFQIIAKNSLDTDHRDLKLVIRYREPAGNWKRLLINTDAPQGTQDEILIRQIAPSN